MSTVALLIFTAHPVMHLGNEAWQRTAEKYAPTSDRCWKCLFPNLWQALCSNTPGFLAERQKKLSTRQHQTAAATFNLRYLSFEKREVSNLHRTTVFPKMISFF
jgi:hypothetical protein